MKQLDSNLAALDMPLSAEHLERLDKLSEPKLNFHAQYLKIAPNFSNAGATDRYEQAEQRIRQWEMEIND